MYRQINNSRVWLLNNAPFLPRIDKRLLTVFCFRSDIIGGGSRRGSQDLEGFGGGGGQRGGDAGKGGGKTGDPILDEGYASNYPGGVNPYGTTLPYTTLNMNNDMDGDAGGMMGGGGGRGGGGGGDEEDY